MGNTQQSGVKEDDHHHGGSGSQLSVFLDQVLAGVAEDPLAGGHDSEATSMLKNYRKSNTDAYGGGISSSRRTDTVRPSRRGRQPVPEGVQFVLNTLPVDPSCVGDGDGFTAHVKEMAGDTNNRDSKKYRIRMRGIDAPELNMEYGKKSKNGLVKLIGEKCVEIHVYGKDHFDRYIGDVYCDGVFIQEQMLKRGLAWHFKKYDNRSELAQWEREAKLARIGLWISDNPQAPWDWKRDHPMNKKKENANDIQSTLKKPAPLNATTRSTKPEPKSNIRGSKDASTMHSHLIRPARMELQVAGKQKSSSVNLPARKMLSSSVGEATFARLKKKEPPTPPPPPRRPSRTMSKPTASSSSVGGRKPKASTPQWH